jgi:hypothetical protein
MIGKKVKKFFTKTLVGNIIDKVAFGGVIKTTDSKTQRTNEGEFDTKEFVLEIITSSIPVILLVSLLFGWLDLETLKELAKILIP